MNSLLIIPKEITFSNIALNNTSSSSFMVKNTTNQFQNFKIINNSENKYKIEPESFSLHSQEEQLIKIKTTIDNTYIHTTDNYIQIVGDQLDQKIKVTVLKYKSIEIKSNYSTNTDEDDRQQANQLQTASFPSQEDDVRQYKPRTFRKTQVQDQEILIQELNYQKDERDEIIMQQELIIKDQQITIENLRKEFEINNDFENDKQKIYDEVQNLEDLIKNYKQEIEIQQIEFSELKNKLTKQINDNIQYQNKISELQQQIQDLNMEQYQKQEVVLPEIMELKEKLLQEEYNCAQLENQLDQISQNNQIDIQQREENLQIQIEQYDELQKENQQNLVDYNNLQTEFTKLENLYSNCLKELQEQINENKKNLDTITNLQSNRGQELESDQTDYKYINNTINRQKSIRELKYLDQDSVKLKQINQETQQSLEIKQKENTLLRMDIENLKQNFEREIIEISQSNMELKRQVQDLQVQNKQYQSKLIYEEKIQQNDQQEKDKLYQQLSQLKREISQLSILKPNQIEIQKIQRQQAQSSDQKEMRYNQQKSLQNDTYLKQENQDLIKEKIRTDQRFLEYIEQSKSNNQMQQKKEEILTEQITILKKQVEKLKKRNNKLKSQLNVDLSGKEQSVTDSVIPSVPSIQEIKNIDSQRQQDIEQLYSPDKDKIINTLRQQIIIYESDIQLKDQQINNRSLEKSDLLLKIENRFTIESQLQNEITQLRDSVQKLKEDKKKIQKDMQIKEDQIVDNKLLIDDQLKQIKKLEKNNKDEFEKYQQQIQEKTEKINQNQLEQKTLQNDQSESQKQIEKLHQEISKLQSDNRLQRTELNQNDNQIKNLFFEIQSLQKNLSQDQIQHLQKLDDIREEKAKSDLVIQFLNNQMGDQQKIYQEMYNLQEKKLMNLRKICSNEIVQLYDKIILKIKTLVDPNPKGKNAKKKDEKPTEIDKKFIGQQFDEYFGSLQTNTGNQIVITQLKEQNKNLTKEKNELQQKIKRLIEEQSDTQSNADPKQKKIAQVKSPQKPQAQGKQLKKSDSKRNLKDELPSKPDVLDKDQQMSQIATLEAQLITMSAQLNIAQEEASFYKELKQQFEQEVDEYKNKSKILQEVAQNLEIKYQDLQKQVKSSTKPKNESVINLQDSVVKDQQEQIFQEKAPQTPGGKYATQLNPDFRQEKEFQFQLKEKEIFIAELQNELKSKRETIQNMKVAIDKLTGINNNDKEQNSLKISKTDSNQQSNLQQQLTEKEKVINQLREQLVNTPPKSIQYSPINLVKQQDQFNKLEKDLDKKTRALEEYKDKLDMSLQEIDDLKLALKKKKKAEENFFYIDNSEKLKQIIITIHRELLLKVQERKYYNMNNKNSSFEISPSKTDNDSFYQKMNDFDIILNNFKDDNTKYILEIFIKLIDALSAQDMRNYQI